MGGNRESVLKGWETRRAEGGRNNKRVIDHNGVIRSDAVVKDPVTGCWIWQYSCRGSTPQAVVEGSEVPISVRAYVYEKTGRPPLRTYYAECGNPKCVNPDHATGERVSYSYLAKQEKIREYAKKHKMLRTKELSEKLGVGRSTIRKSLGQRPGSSVGKRWQGRRLPKQPDYIDDRRWDIFTRVATGASMQSVATDYKVSRERIRGICEQVEMWLDRGSGDRVYTKSHQETHNKRPRKASATRG